MLAKAIVLIFIILIIILTFKKLAEPKTNSHKKDDDIVDLEKDKDGKYSAKDKKNKKE